ncbi:decorin-binding protein DbpA [Borreliella afzelii]|uniref:decorin-binding protein DbpA n=1 Tax=Borreliella afzelii TaxID=29518 RepID=UPI003AF52254
MIKYNKIILTLTLLASLLAACSLTGKARLESSVKDITNEIEKAIKAAEDEGVKTDAFTETRTGGKVAGPKIRAAKIHVADLTIKFLEATEEETITFKENGAGEDEFSGIYDLILNAAKAVEKIGMKDMTKTVEEAAKENPKTTANGIIAIVKVMKAKVENIKEKQTKNQK